MRIAFDLDDTLIPTTLEFAVGSSELPFPFNLVFKERLRSGAIDLLRLLSQDHELWIYTTSLRTPIYLKVWFKIQGVSIHTVINRNAHVDAVRGNQRYSNYSKAPKLFGVDLLIDDLTGVKMECNEQGCDCLIISPEEKDWVQLVKRKVSLFN